MKTAIYIEDGVVQLVITPESEFERNALRSFGGKSTNTKIINGSFYDCRGGWTRQKFGGINTVGMPIGELPDTEDCSLIVRTENNPKEESLRDSLCT